MQEETKVKDRFEFTTAVEISGGKKRAEAIRGLLEKTHADLGKFIATVPEDLADKLVKVHMVTMGSSPM